MLTEEAKKMGRAKEEAKTAKAKAETEAKEPLQCRGFFAFFVP